MDRLLDIFKKTIKEKIVIMRTEHKIVDKVISKQLKWFV